MEDRNNGKQYWRSLNELADSPDFISRLEKEYPEAAAEIELSGVSRRRFLELMGASVALAGVGMAGCVRKPVEHILPFSKRPEDLTPGVPSYFATSMNVGMNVYGVLACSNEGRPTKIEGNPQHPTSLGAANAWAQASVLGLYDPDRSQRPMKRDGDKGLVPAEKGEFEKAFGDAVKEWKKNGGDGLALLLQSNPSPTYARMLDEVRRGLPRAALYFHDPVYPSNRAEAFDLLGVAPRRAVVYNLDKARVILSIDSDFLGLEGDSVKNARQFADGRRLGKETESMNRLYAVEPAFTVTGAMADNRLQIPAAHAGEFLKAVAAELFSRAGGSDPTGGKIKADAGRFGKWVPAVVKDLADNRREALVVVGDRQPAWVHALGFLVNHLLNPDSATVSYPAEIPGPRMGSLKLLAADAKAGKIKALVVLGGNPIYTADADSGIADAYKTIPLTIHHGLYADETAQASAWHIPESHYLEAWGDLQCADGTPVTQQPLIAPLYDTWSGVELLARIAGGEAKGYDLVRATWKARTGNPPGFENLWRQWLHDGVITNVPRTIAGRPAFDWSKLGAIPGLAQGPAQVDANSMEVNFIIDPSVADGRFANNGWLQELPDPITKLTWDNAVCIGPVTAMERGLKNNDVVELRFNNHVEKGAVFIVPGTAEHTVTIALGYGRQAGGRVQEKAGFNAYKLRVSGNPFFGSGLLISAAVDTYTLATTQEHGSMEGRPLVRENTLDGLRQKPDFVNDLEFIKDPSKIKSLWKEPHPWLEGAGKEGGPKYQQWGMAIDLNVCTGCNACAIACQAENNVPVVGKKQVLRGREMHWIRLDRYFNGDKSNPQAVIQPMPCQQCENAPCESVCPVAATAHSPEGLNDMAYNRCIGTRYCANNCPFKVRRFNFFNFNLDYTAVEKMQKNPDVTVRFRGVMEKCTYCVQRINRARSVAKRTGDGHIKDGAVTPACAQTCPTQAITFGDIADPGSRVSMAKNNSRDYVLLAELNIKPRTSYLAKIRNPNPELA
ncbi:MAG: hypothetical protein GMKNLPBB_01694 [Myxococcota bacterium]|nr:hypothetical protein [Myxococcota bacterium]